MLLSDAIRQEYATFKRFGKVWEFRGKNAGVDTLFYCKLPHKSLRNDPNNNGFPSSQPANQKN